MNLRFSMVVGLIIAVLFTPSATAQKSAIRVLTTRSIATVLNETGAEFERATGHKLVVTSDIAIRMVRSIRDGEMFDVLVASPEQIDALIKEGLIIGRTRTNLARSGIGVEVRSGAPKPDISSVEAFKRTLLGAKSVAYLKEGQSGVYLAGLIDRLGLTEALRPKVIRPETDIVSEMVARGEVDLGLVVITQILTTRGVELVGPLPAEIQSYIVFAGGVSTRSRAPIVAEELIKFLTSPRAKGVMRAQGMEPCTELNGTTCSE